MLRFGLTKHTRTTTTACWDEADIAEVEALAQAYYDAVDARESADEVAETPDVPEVDGAENTTDE